jgi:transposase
MARYDLNEAEWRLIAPLLSVARGDERRAINGIAYMLRTGSP